MNPDVRLEVRADPKLLRAVRAFLRSYLESQGLGAEAAANVVLAVDEACANSIRHAYHFSTTGVVDLVILADDAGLEVQVADQGETADPTLLRRRELGAGEVQPPAPGGLGVQIMYRVFDEVSYAPGERGGNRVTMRLAWPGGAGAAPRGGA